MEKIRAVALILVALLAASGNAFGQSPTGTTPKRVIYYYQTQYYNSVYQSLSPIWNQINPKTGKPDVTDLMVASFHLGFNSDGSPYIHLNDNVPSDSMFTQMWAETATLQTYGVTVRMLLGGAAQGSYADLFSNFEEFYPLLQSTIQTYNLNGFDMDVEEIVSLSDIQKLIDQLHTDFGPSFILTMSPVASALWGGANLSGFDYKDLAESAEGKLISWYNGQFYSGFATLANTADYEKIVAYGFPANQVVGGMIGNPADGSGYVVIGTVSKTVTSLVGVYPNFGGVAS
jgi:hypothetical protein